MAKKFKFRLAKVLEYRKLVKNEQKKVLVEKNQRLAQLESEKERILQELIREELVDEVSSPAQLHLLGMYHARLRDELTSLELNLITAREEKEEALMHYQKAARDEEALLRLYEKKKAEHVVYILKEEGKFLDELGTQKGNTQYGD